MTDSLFNEREQAFETKFAHDAELDFITKTRGGAMFAEWVSGLLQLSTDEATRYSHRLLEEIVMGRSHDEVLQRVKSDLTEAGHKITNRALEARIVECQSTARRALY